MRPLLLLIMLIAAFSLSGCIGDDEELPEGEETAPNGPEEGISEPEPVTVEVGLSGVYPATIAYDPTSFTVIAGQQVTIVFTNNDGNPLVNHDWVLEGYEDTASTPMAANGETKEITFTAPSEPGDYTFYCSVPGHRGNGMEGTLTVQ